VGRPHLTHTTASDDLGAPSILDTPTPTHQHPPTRRKNRNRLHPLTKNMRVRRQRYEFVDSNTSSIIAIRVQRQQSRLDNNEMDSTIAIQVRRQRDGMMPSEPHCDEPQPPPPLPHSECILTLGISAVHGMRGGRGERGWESHRMPRYSTDEPTTMKAAPW